MSHARFVPPDHDKGDANTIGGYQAVHARPAAFEGPDGFSYSVEIMADDTSGAAGAKKASPAAGGAAEAELPWGAYILFVRWHRTGEQTPAGHLETGYLSRGMSEQEVLADVARLPLSAVKELLDACVIAATGTTTPRRWWDAMRDEGE
ncbi:MAG: hypothetical protein ACJ79K_10720 [Gemmatimonadaceae bacterium]